MLFDIVPKTNLNDLFGREREFRWFKEALDLGERLIVIYGVRRVGKTSLLKASLYELSVPHVLIDVREVYGEYGYVTRNYLYKQMAEYFTSNLGFFEKLGYKLRDLLKHIKAFHLRGMGVEVDLTTNVSITTVFKEFNNWAKRHNSRFVIAFDEAQYLRFSGITRYDKIFAWAIDNLENLTIVLTGSEVGVLRDFLKLDNPKAPLYGRYYREIVLKSFTKEQSLEFMRRGFQELNLKIPSSELEEVVSKLGGIPGWLTLYGYYRGVRKLSHEDTLKMVFEEGSKLVMKELDKIIAPSRRRYLAILEAITRGASKWIQIKAYVEFRTGTRIADKNFTDLLKKLTKYSIVEKRDNQYRIADPLIEYSIKTIAL